MNDAHPRPYGKIDDNKLIAGLTEGLSKTEAGIAAGSHAQRHNVPDVVRRKSENIVFKEKLEEHISLLQKYITEDKIAQKDIESLVWMLDKLCRIMVATTGGMEYQEPPIPIMGGLSIKNIPQTPPEA